MSSKDGAEAAVRDIRRTTRKQYSAGENIRIVLLGSAPAHPKDNRNTTVDRSKF